MESSSASVDDANIPNPTATIDNHTAESSGEVDISTDESSNIRADNTGESNTTGGSNATSSSSSSIVVNNTIGNSELRRSERPRQLSLKGKESKIMEVTAELVKCISALLVTNEDSLTKVSSMEIEELYTELDFLQQSFDNILEMYSEIELLCNNKPNKDIEKMFNDLSDDMKVTKQTLMERVQFLEQSQEEQLREIEDAMNEAQRKLDAEMERYYEIQRRREMKKSQSVVTTDKSESRLETAPQQELRQLQPSNSSIGNDRRSDTPAQQERQVSRPLRRATEQLSQPEVINDVKPSAPGLEAIEKLANCLAMSMKSTKLPALEPSVFKGSSLAYTDWEVEFNAFVESQQLSGVERLHYLKKYVDGEAKECISGHFLTNSPEAYIAARKRLKERFGNPFELARAFRKKLADWIKITPKDGKGLMKYADFLSQCDSAMCTIKDLSILNDYQENEKLAGKLPDWMKLRWGRQIADTRRMHCRYPTFTEFCTFVRKEAEVMEEPILQNMSPQDRPPRKQSQDKLAVRAFHTKADEIKACLCCNRNNHKTTECFQLARKPYRERIDFVRTKRLCFSCLTPFHQASACTAKASCKKCNKVHPTSLHDETRSREVTYDRKERIPGQQAKESNEQSKAQKVEKISEVKKVNAHTAQVCNGQAMSMVVPVYISNNSSNSEKLVYALLDTQADASFISKEVAIHMGRPDKQEELTILTLNGETTSKVNKYCNIKVRGYSTSSITTIQAYEQESLSCDKNRIPTINAAKQYTHLRGIAGKLPPPLDIPIGLLIGTDCPEALAPYASIPGQAGEIFAIETIFGWTLCGGIHKTAEKQRVHTVHVPSAESSMLALMKKDFKDAYTEDVLVSQNDIKFMRMLADQTKQRKDGFYEAPLPFSTRPELPNNVSQAMKRLEILKRKFDKDASHQQEYTSTIDKLISNGQAELIPKDEQVSHGQVWYIPHFGVTHPKKHKIRVVFDGSARYKNIAINDYLLQGPDHINSLLGILCRFRRHEIAISCDVEGMFYNFYVDSKDRNFLRFLWFDKEMHPTHYRMKVHIFGACSSPAVATYCLRRIAQDYHNISPEASKFIINDFYVDDGLTSVASAQEAEKLIYDARSICDKGNVRLHKFLSNDRTVLESIPESERSVQNSELFEGDLPTQRTLGLQWSVETDTFGFSSSLEASVPTRRTILSTVSKIYDPIGFLAPFTFKGKLVLQELCRQKLSWDDVVPEEIWTYWQEWVEQLNDLQDYKIERCMKPKDFGSTQKVELHHFCDASSKGYGACTYVRMENSEQKVHLSLLMAKARVAPIMQTTVPRLELQGAVLASRLSQTLKKELDMKIDAEYFWCDSMIVLGYINNVSKRFHVFVANRVDEIRATTDPNQWRYIKTSENPADTLSRGADIKELQQSRWLHGPAYLWKKEISKEVEDAKPKLKEVNEEDPEVRKVKIMSVKIGQSDQNDFLAKRFDKFSSMTKLVRAVANLMSMARNKSWKRNKISLENLEEAERFIMLNTQALHFEQEVKSLKAEQHVRKDSRLAKLNPYLDKEGLLRVGGRLHNATNLDELQKHPIVIPKSCHISILIVRHYHERIHHLGHRSTLAAVRDAGFWLVNGPGITKTVIGKCTICARLRKPAEVQQMGILPTERAMQTPPFTHVGMDVFGPFVVKQKRAEHKRWGLLFTCLYSRAIHVEILEELTTDAFLNALRCLIAIRGPVKTLFSDRGTNFIGANNMLERLMDMVKEPEMKAYLEVSKISFKMNTPDSSHQGGVWERLIRSVRAVLNGMTMKYKGRMDTPTLRTALYEAMAIVNSRPLTASTISDPEQNIISPNHLLTMKTSSAVAPPPGKFEDDEAYSRLCWRRAQCFADEFWKAWKTEYLNQLTQRQKWTHERQNIRVGDVVAIVENDTPRGVWKLARVCEVTPGIDGLVRKVKVKVGNPQITMRGIPYAQPTILERPVQKLVIVVKV